MRAALSCALCALGILLPSTAQAAAYYFADAGTKALGRGGAFVAGVDDLSAQYYNPAALTRLKGGQVYLSGSLIDQYVTFDRADEVDDNDEPIVFDSAANGARYRGIPAISASHDFGLPWLTAAVGFYSPFSPDLEYPADGGQRYILIDNLIWEFCLGPSVGVQVLDWLSVGAGAQVWFLRVDQQLAITNIAGSDPDWDIDVDISVWDKMVPSANFGLLAEPTKWLSIGASAQPPIQYAAEGSLTTDFTDHNFEPFLDGTSFQDPDVTMLLTVPWVLRGGVAVRPIDKLEIEADYVWEGWHVIDVVKVTDVDLTVKVDPKGILSDDILVTNDIDLVANYQDSWSARLGAEYDLSRRFSLRAGGYYETAAIPDASIGVQLVDSKKWSVGGGATAHLGRFDVDLGVARTQLANREITDSVLQQLLLEIDLADPQASEVTFGDYVGNGYFNSHLVFGSAALTWRFGKDAPSRQGLVRPG